MLVVKAKRNPDFISELFDKEILKDRKRDRIEAVVNQMDTADSFIDSSRTVIKQIEKDQLDSAEEDKLQIKEHEACKLMRELGMRYRKVNHIALSANSERSLVLR